VLAIGRIVRHMRWLASPASDAMFFLARISILVCCIGLVSCSSLLRYETATAHLPGDSLIQVGPQKVHVERAGEGRPLVLIHGFASSTYEFRKIIPLLARQHRVIALDLNGFGYTERPATRESYTPLGQADLVMRTLDTLGIHSCDLVGHSFGGTIALQIAHRHPERVGKIVLISPLSQVDRSPLLLSCPAGRLLAFGTARSLVSLPGPFQSALSQSYYQKDALTHDDSEEYRKRLLIKGMHRSFFSFSHSLVQKSEFNVDLTSIEASTLIITGQHDRVIPLASCRQAAQRLPRGQLTVLEQSGHSAPEEEPDKVADAILEFLRFGKD
jgi:pimeloyl-ACP methyl ester carboxylesterase